MSIINFINDNKEMFSIELRTEDQSEIDSILDQLNINKSTIKFHSGDGFAFVDPVIIDIENEAGDIIATLTHEPIAD